jgi:hypothetical protein
MAGGCGRWRSTRWATTPSAPIRCTSTGHFLIARSSLSGIACGFPLRFAGVRRRSTWAASYDKYHGFYRRAEIDDGDLDYYVIAGPMDSRRSSPAS